MSKKGGSSDAAPALKYSQKALDLQKQMYEEGKAYAQPYYQAGTTGLNELMMRMGLGGGQPSAQSAEQYRQSIMPKYTKTTTTPGTTNLWTDGKNVYSHPGSLGPGHPEWTPLSTGAPVTSSTVDTAALEADVQKYLADQAAQGAAAQSNPLYGSLLKNYTGQDIYQDPSYKFRFEQGNKAAERALAAQGKYLAPAGVQALTDYGQGLASQEYQNAYNRFNADQENIYNRLANIAGLGQTAGAQNAQLGANYANAGSDLYTGMGNSIMAAQQAARANRASMFNTILGGASQLGAAAFMSDPALKENITHVGEENGHNIYKFTYKDDKSKTYYIGVMADEVQKTNPEAVIEKGGYLAVDYDKINVKFREA